MGQGSWDYDTVLCESRLHSPVQEMTPTDLLRVLRDAAAVAGSAIRFVNPYQRDQPPPNPGPSRPARRVLGGVGAVAAILSAAMLKPDRVGEALSSTWLIVLHVVLALIAVFAGCCMGQALKDRASFKVLLGPFFGCPAIMLVFSVLMTMIHRVSPNAVVGSVNHVL